MSGDEGTQQTLVQPQPNTADMNIERLIEAFTADSKASRDHATLLMQNMEQRLQQAEERNRLADERIKQTEERH